MDSLRAGAAHRSRRSRRTRTPAPPAPSAVAAAPGPPDLRLADSPVEQYLAGNGLDNRVDAFALCTVGHQHRPAASHLVRFPAHAIEVDIHIRRQGGLVDDHPIAREHAAAALARNV